VYVGDDMTIRLPVGQPLIWNQAAIDALGKQSDLSLAKMLGIDNRTVRAKRRSLNIPAWRMPKRRHTRRCVVCGREFVITGGRLSRLRRTCPPVHRFTRAGQPSACQRQLVSRTQMLTRNPTSARGLVKKLGARRVIRLLDG
jgi:hypothetical protein